MRPPKASLLLLKIAFCDRISECSSSPSSWSSSRSHISVSRRTFKSLSSHHRSSSNGRQQTHDLLLFSLRGGQQQQPQPEDDITGSYHGNYIFNTGEEPRLMAAPPMTSAAAAAGPAATNDQAQTAVSSPTMPPPSASTPPPVLAIATSTDSKISNLQERTGPAILMLGAIFLLLKYTGKAGLIGLVFLMQLAMYAESTSIVEDYYSNRLEAANPAIAAAYSEEEKFISVNLQKWWWFATAIMMTSGRCVFMKLLNLLAHRIHV